MSFTTRTHLLLAAVLALAVSGLVGREACARSKGQPSDSGTKPWVVVKGKLGDVNGKGDQVIADFNTEDQAGKYAKECNENEQSLSITYMVRKRSDWDSGSGGKKAGGQLKHAKDVVDHLKEAKGAVDKAVKIAKEGLTEEERKLGDTLKEYSDAVKKAYESAKNAKTDLLSMTDSITQKQFNDVNKLIDSYNGYNDSLAQYRKLPGGTTLPSLPSIATVKPGDLNANVLPEQTPIVKLPRVDPGPYKFMDGYNDPLKKGAESKQKEGDKLSGTVWDARWLSSYGGELRFGKDGKSVTHVWYAGGPHPGGTAEGTYVLKGDTFTMRFKNGYLKDGAIYTGTIDGNKIVGTWRLGDIEDKWEVTRK